MGKKHENYDDYDEEISQISPEYYKEVAEVLDGFLNFAKKTIIYKKLTPEQYKDAVKTVKKYIKKLRKGNPKAMDRARLSDAVIRGEIPDEYLL